LNGLSLLILKQEIRMLRSLTLTLCSIIICLFSSYANDSTAIALKDSVSYWTFKGNNTLNINQVALSNWAKGGESTVSGSAFVNYSLKYQKDNLSFENIANCAYGLIYSKENGVRKNEDKIDLSSKLAYKSVKKWHTSLLLSFKSQFDKGYKYPNDSVVVSQFMAPGYVGLSVGMDYKPSEHLSMFISPASGKFVLVLDQELANKGAYGVSPAEYDTANTIIQEGKNVKCQFGLAVVTKFEKEIMKNISLGSKLELYNNYLDEDVSNRWNIDVDWETSLAFKVNAHFSTNFHTHLIYDHDILIPTYDIVDGQEVKVGSGPKTQFKENFGIGLSVKF